MLRVEVWRLGRDAIEQFVGVVSRPVSVAVENVDRIVVEQNSIIWVGDSLGEFGDIVCRIAVFDGPQISLSFNTVSVEVEVWQSPVAL